MRMTFLKDRPSFQRVTPSYVVPGGRVTVLGSGFNGRLGNTSTVQMNGVDAHITCARSKSITILVPDGIDADVTSLTVADTTFGEVGLRVATVVARDVHPVDNPVLDREGNIYTTISGSRGEQTAVSIIRIRPDGTCEPYLKDIMNPTSLAFGPDGALYVSSRFNGVIYRVASPTDVTTYAEGLGTATGIAFDRDGSLLVGDRCGTLFRVTASRKVLPVLSIAPSVAAFHLCVGPDGAIYVTNPDISTYDAILRVAPGASEPTVFYPGIKRPQGMAFDEEGNLYVAKAMAGDSGIIRISPKGKAAMIVSGPVLVGLALDQRGTMILAGTDALYRLSTGLCGSSQSGGNAAIC